MSTEPSRSKEITLEEKEVFSFRDHTQVFIGSGLLWMTIDGDNEDYFLREGETFDVPSGRHAVVQALGKAHFWF